MVWKTPLPPGHSSPVVSADRIFLSGAKDESVLTVICLERASGKLLWEKEIPYDTLEKVHLTGSHAQSSPVTDGERVVTFFGSSGLWCHDKHGKLLWHKKMGPFKNDFGAGSSPIIVDDKVILCQDHDTDSFLAAYNKTSGEELWKTDRSEFPRNFSTPVVWEQNGKKQIVVPATLRIVAYDFDSGKEIWTVRGVARIVNMSPVVGDDGILYVGCWSPGGDEENRIQVDTFDSYAEKNDKNKDKMIDEKEVADPTVKQRFSQIDRDKSGTITRTEWENMRRVFEDARNRILAIKPGGQGDITETHVLWSFNKQLPYCPSPLFHDGTLYMVKDGGIFSSLDAKTGKPIKQGRVQGNTKYFASPVLGDGKIYVVSDAGQLTVVSATPKWQQLFSTDFGESVYGTPAIVDGHIYFRTKSFLYCFGQQVSASR
ncbi:MAG: PQQ-binding-like beta-propeller repeat protein [Planctomycetales bacterium]